MKKIITLSIVCLVSGQLFAQAKAATSSDVTATKTQIEAQKQKKMSSMSLKQANDANGIKAVTPPVVSQQPANAKLKTKVKTVAKKPKEVKSEQELKQIQEVKPPEAAKTEATLKDR